MPANPNTGHRQRLRERFLAGQVASDEMLLELLLTYAIPQQDVQPIAAELVRRFGSLPDVLAASYDDLCAVPGVKTQTAILLKLVHQLRLDELGVDGPK